MAGLIGAGALLATAPLWVAVWLSGAALERLSAHNQRLVDQGIAVTRQGAALHDQLTDLQRNARQYEVLADEQLLPVLFGRALRARDDGSAAIVLATTLRNLAPTIRFEPMFGRRPNIIMIIGGRVFCASWRPPRLLNGSANQ